MGKNVDIPEAKVDFQSHYLCCALVLLYFKGKAGPCDFLLIVDLKMSKFVIFDHSSPVIFNTALRVYQVRTSVPTQSW